MSRLLVAVFVGLIAAVACNSAKADLIVGGFDAARGGMESLAPGENSALASQISSAYPGTTFSFTSTLTPTFFSGINAVILGVATGGLSAVTPLSTSEQSALRDFVLGGGTALIFADNSIFAPGAPTTNASFLNPFGVSITDTLNGGQTAPMINPAGPLTSPFPASAFYGYFTGYFNNTGQGAVLANFGAGEPAIDYFAPGALGPGSGEVVLFADSNVLLVDGDASTPSNSNLILNALATPEPPAWTMMFLGMVGAGVTVGRKRPKLA